MDVGVLVWRVIRSAVDGQAPGVGHVLKQVQCFCGVVCVMSYDEKMKKIFCNDRFDISDHLSDLNSGLPRYDQLAKVGR